MNGAANNRGSAGLRRGTVARFALCATFLLLLLTPASLFAQEAPRDEAALREWFESLPPERRNRLRHRQRVFKRLSKERQSEVLASARSGKPIFSAEENANLEKLRLMGDLQRLRLFTLANELQQLRRNPDPRVEKALRERNTRELYMRLRERRARAFRETLPAEKRDELAKSPQPQRALMRLYDQETAARRERLIEMFPGIKETRDKARAGDAKARAELRRNLADLWTLDMMLQRLHPQARERVLGELANRPVEDAGRQLRDELRKQWQRDRRERPPGRERPGRRHDGAVRPGEDRPRGPRD
jgi:hypothetical protein